MEELDAADIAKATATGRYAQERMKKTEDGEGAEESDGPKECIIF